MIEQIYTYFTIETLYMWVNLGVLPFWFILIFFPKSHLCRYFVASIFPIFILSGAYIFALYKSYQLNYDFIGNFTLYLGLDELSRLFEDHLYLMIFWTHFVAINLFLGGWIVKDAQKFNIFDFLDFFMCDVCVRTDYIKIKIYMTTHINSFFLHRKF